MTQSSSGMVQPWDGRVANPPVVFRIAGHTVPVAELASLRRSPVNTQREQEILADLEAAKARGPSNKFKAMRAVTLGIIGVATGGAAYSALAGGAATGASASGSASGLGGASGAVGKTTVLAGSGLGGAAPVVSPVVAASGVPTATAVASGVKEWTLAGAIKEYGGTALKVLSGSSAPSTPDEANRTPPFNSNDLFADYAYGYGEGGGMGGGPMLTTGGEPTAGIFDEIVSSPWILAIGGAILLLLGFFFIKR